MMCAGRKGGDGSVGGGCMVSSLSCSWRFMWSGSCHLQSQQQTADCPLERSIRG